MSIINGGNIILEFCIIDETLTSRHMRTRKAE